MGFLTDIAKLSELTKTGMPSKNLHPHGHVAYDLPYEMLQVSKEQRILRQGWHSKEAAVLHAQKHGEIAARSYTFDVSALCPQMMHWLWGNVNNSLGRTAMKQPGYNRYKLARSDSLS